MNVQVDRINTDYVCRSTGCPWCYARGIVPVGINEVCDLWVKKYRTNAILEHYCHFHWSEWLLKELKGIDKDD